MSILDKEAMKMVREGEQAIDFTLPAMRQAEPVSLQDFRGRYVILYFYPKDDTPGCTTQACGFRDQNATLTAANAVIIGISRDSITAHEKFAERYQLPFLLLSDKEGKVCEQYGVIKERKLFGKMHKGIIRTSFLIDPAGKVLRVYRDIKVEHHAAEILRDLHEFAST